jgi:adenine/guanine phosphoribosyltransferase-like PRPP-binding protein
MKILKNANVIIMDDAGDTNITAKEMDRLLTRYGFNKEDKIHSVVNVMDNGGIFAQGEEVRLDQH